MSGVSPARFHSHHGSNIELYNQRTTATRTSSFANALTFSDKPLSPGEIFLIEIEENQSGWSGYMRIGLTQMNPNSEFSLPLYALPDLVSIGPSWLFAITKTHNNLYEQGNQNLGGIPELEMAADDLDELGEQVLPMFYPMQENMFNYRRKPALIREGSLIRTPRGFISQKALLPTISRSSEKEDGLLPTDVGSRIGVMYVPTDSEMADMHFIINGEDQGPCAREIPYKTPLFAVVDVYGSTKQVRVIQLYGVESLQSICRDVILQSIQLSGISNLPLPKMLKDYLLYM